MSALRHSIVVLVSALTVQLSQAGVSDNSDTPAAKGGALVTVEQTPNVKAPSVKNIDTAAEKQLPAGRPAGTVRASGTPTVTVAVGGMVRSESASDGRRMKCWQFGRLLVDKKVKVLPVEAPATRSRVVDADTGAEVVTFDLKNAMCIVE